MIYRFLCLLYFILLLTTIAHTAMASSAEVYSVIPDASAYVLAPMGLAAVLAAKRRRQRLAQIQQGVGTAYFVIKRSFDISLSLTLLAIFSPIFALIALIVRLDSPGPVLFKRRVIGKYGKSFDMYKFRSMVCNAEEILKQNKELRKIYCRNFKLDDDPRVTKIGKFLRKSSLDELPQLINVFLGNMTFVGPRPIHSDEIEIYGPAIEDFQTVTPGITGLWQAYGRSETSYECRVKMDMLYIEKRCILLDLWIILRTIPAVLLKRGAY